MGGGGPLGVGEWVTMTLNRGGAHSSSVESPQLFHLILTQPEPVRLNLLSHNAILLGVVPLGLSISILGRSGRPPSSRHLPFAPPWRGSKSKTSISIYNSLGKTVKDKNPDLSFIAVTTPGERSSFLSFFRLSQHVLRGRDKN